MFGSAREFFLWGGDCWGAVKFEILHLYELQQELRCLSVFDLMGRWRIASKISNGMVALMGRLIKI
jgi:hypothetical protein